jgi:starch-binding outer membrane protein, SusD/RagB family
MKKIFHKVILIAFIGLPLACGKDPLDITPDGRISLDDVFKDEKLTEAYLNTAYNNIPSYFNAYHFWSFIAGISDEAKDSDSGVEGNVLSTNWNPGNLSPTSNPLEITAQAGVVGNNRYNTYWKGIREANIFLENVNTANIPSEKNKNRFTAEAKLLRAFYYFELIKQFGPMPITDKPFTPTTDYTKLVRPTFQANVDFIVKDCNEGINTPDLPIRITEESERGRFTRAVAHAIKSQALLYNASPLWNPSNDIAKWAAAAKATKEALDELTANGNYVLYPNYGEYFELTSDISANPKDRETIFERPGSPSGTSFTTLNTIPRKSGFKAGSCPSQELVDSYGMVSTGEPAILGYSDEDHLQPILNPGSGYNPANPYVGRDPRMAATVWFNGALYDNVATRIVPIESFVGGLDGLIRNNRKHTHTGYYLRKFINPKTQLGVAQPSRWKKFHLAELYLNYAEAENEAAGPNDNVYNALNTIRKRAGMPNMKTGLSKEVMRDRIRNERQVELAIEEHRFYDVRRWKILDKTDKVVTGMEITKLTNGTFTYKRFVSERRNAWSDKFRIFPLPQGEVNNIPDFNLNQNPGW